jgi:hypothetical protein
VPLEAARPAEVVRLAESPWRRRVRHPAVWAAVAGLSVLGAGFALLSRVSGWDPAQPFMRNAPAVDDAIALLDAGEHARAAELLEEYLGTGACSKGEIALPPTVRAKHHAGFDLGLTLFHLAEKYGGRFGDEEVNPDGGFDPPEIDEGRTLEIKCAMLVAKAIAGDTSVPAELRARAFFLSGNLEFLQRKYEESVEQYDLALQLVPGIAEDAGGDLLGRDVAWNRSIALRRQLENDAGPPPEQPDAEPNQDDGGPQEQGPEDGGDDGGDQENDGGDQEDQDGGGDQQEQDGGADEQDGGDDGGPEPQAGQGGNGDEQMGEIAESGEEGERYQLLQMLDELEDAPTYQQEEAKKRVDSKRRVLEDK